jgi:deazaflavin-dependent oxidoreductase (nitroreductase family)
MDGSAREKGNAMPYLKPPGFTRRVVNPLVSRLHSGGVETLTVVGRRTGRPHAVPVIPVQIGECRYLVSPYGEADWVRNLRAAGEGELQGRGTTERFAAREVPVAERAAVIAAYRAVAGRTVASCFRDLPDPADHPVFVIEREELAT